MRAATANGLGLALMRRPGDEGCQLEAGGNAAVAAGEKLGVEAIVERTEYALRRRFARIATVAELARELANKAA